MCNATMIIGVGASGGAFALVAAHLANVLGVSFYLLDTLALECQ